MWTVLDYYKIEILSSISEKYEQDRARLDKLVFTLNPITRRIYKNNNEHFGMQNGPSKY